MAQICAQCGTPIKEGYRFCSNCGAAVGAPPKSEAPTIAPFEPPEPTLTSEAVPAPPTLYGPQRPPPPPLPRGAVPSRAATMRPDPQEGGMYVPYGAEAETHIEQAGSARSRAMPVIIISAILLAGLVALTAYLLIGQKPVPQPILQPSLKPTIAAANCDLPPNATEEDRVRQVVCLSNEEQIKAWRDLDVEVLRGTRTGPVLDENIAFVEDLKKKGLYGVPVLDNLDIKEVKIDGDTATVRTVETWSVTFYNNQDNSVVESRPPQTLAETYHMVKQDGKWMVERLEFNE